MDYENRYRAALERAKKLYNDAITLQLEQDIKDYEYIFPELKDSEDERIRKRILFSLQKDIMATKNSGCDIKDLEECIAWLEKQGKQPQGKSALKSIKEKKVVWSEEDETALGDALWCCKQSASIAKDENDMGNIWYAEHWLKSIKDRVQPQWKPSEEQMKALSSISVTGNISYAGQGQKLIDLYNDLKKLKEE